jgi:3-oxoacyl-[acyl-carrier-protein] synthase-3
MTNKGPFNAYISAVGHYFPEKVISNQYFVNYLDTTDEWIRTRTGIVERRFAEPDQPTSFMAVNAARMALENRGMSPDELDLIIVATVSPDMIYPSTACLVQDKLGAKNCWGYDILAACSGFIFALTTAVQFIQSGVHKKIMVIGADKMSMMIDMQDRNTCLLFGDAAAAVIVEPTEDKTLGILDSIMHIDGMGAKYLYQPGGGSLNPTTHETVEKRMH